MKDFASVLWLLALVSRIMAEECGEVEYDPAEQVCHDESALCPIIAGEPLSNCAGECYTKFNETCVDGTLQDLPRVDGPFTLTVSNPTMDRDGDPITACEGRLWIGGDTCSFCPADQACPAGNEAVLYQESNMAVTTPGGQIWYLDQYWAVLYTSPDQDLPENSTVGGFVAYKNGGFVNQNPTALGWAACFPTASGGGYNEGRWTLGAKNEALVEQGRFWACYDVNLEVHEHAGPGAWEYD